MASTRLTTLYYRLAPSAQWQLCGSFQHPAALRAVIASVSGQGADYVTFEWWDSEEYPVMLPESFTTLAEVERHFGYRRAACSLVKAGR